MHAIWCSKPLTRHCVVAWLRRDMWSAVYVVSLPTYLGSKYLVAHTDRAGRSVRLSHVDGTGLEDGARYLVRQTEYCGSRMTVGHWAFLPGTVSV